MKQLTFVLIILSLVGCSEPAGTNSIRTTSNYNGKYADLIEAVKAQNLAKIEQVFADNHLTLNYADSVNGVSLLNWCILNEKEKSFEKLLQIGADPNWQDTDGCYW